MVFAPRCPRCRRPVVWEGNPNRPFCSERCQLIDLEGWASERYRIPGESIDRDLGEEATPAPGAEREGEPGGGGSG